jgi:hypothetical protein
MRRIGRWGAVLGTLLAALTVGVVHAGAAFGAAANPGPFGPAGGGSQEAVRASGGGLEALVALAIVVAVSAILAVSIGLRQRRAAPSVTS